jgi:putative hemolysin
MFELIIIVLITLTLSGFFSGLEIAFLSANKLRVELDSEKGAWANIVSNYMKKPSSFISTVLVGNNIALVIYGIFMEELLRLHFLNEYLSGQSAFTTLFLTTIISTAIVLVFAEFIPKALFRINPNWILKMLIYPFQVFSWLLYVVVQFTLLVSKVILKIVLKKEFTEETPVFTKVDLDHFITESQSHKNIDELDVDTNIIKNVLEFDNVLIRDCMIPRTELEAIELNTPIKDLEWKFIETGYSKILIFEKNIDHIVGYVHQIDLFRKPENISSIKHNILITTESKRANEMLNDFIQKRKSIALVVDEFGGTAGIVTTEDIIEEIFGEIEDEHDDIKDEELLEEIVGQGEFHFSAKLETDYLNEMYDLGIPEGEYDTLGGFIISEHENIPRVGEVIDISPYRITILESSGNRINTVHLIDYGQTDG